MILSNHLNKSLWEKYKKGHEGYILIDSKVFITESYNWSLSENCQLFWQASSPDVTGDSSEFWNIFQYMPDIA